jgi:hypothetical protein
LACVLGDQWGAQIELLCLSGLKIDKYIANVDDPPRFLLYPSDLSSPVTASNKSAALPICPLLPNAFD